jgi:hypothetical protein
MHSFPGVVDSTAELNLFLVRAMYDAFGKKGDRAFKVFRLDLISKEYLTKLIQVKSGDLDKIRFMYDEEAGVLDEVILPEKPSVESGITLADLRDLEMDDDFGANA